MYSELALPAEWDQGAWGTAVGVLGLAAAGWAAVAASLATRAANAAAKRERGLIVANHLVSAIGEMTAFAGAWAVAVYVGGRQQIEIFCWQWGPMNGRVRALLSEEAGLSAENIDDLETAMTEVSAEQALWMEEATELFSAPDTGGLRLALEELTTASTMIRTLLENRGTK